MGCRPFSCGRMRTAFYLITATKASLGGPAAPADVIDDWHVDPFESVSGILFEDSQLFHFEMPCPLSQSEAGQSPFGHRISQCPWTSTGNPPIWLKTRPHGESTFFERETWRAAPVLHC